MRNILLSTVALVAFAGSAVAADLPSRKAAPIYTAPVSVYNWTGFYAGIEGGADFINTRYPGYSNNRAAGLVGGVVGYNYQLANKFVIGLEGDAGGVFGATKRVATPAGSWTKSDSSYFGDIRGRFGYAVDRTLLYVAGGVAFADVKNNYFGVTNTDSRVGWTIGAGADYAFTNNWIGRLEYRYTDLGSAIDGGVRVRQNSNEVLVGLLYKFGAPEAAVVAKY